MNYTKKEKEQFISELFETYKDFINSEAIYKNTLDDDVLEDFLRIETIKAIKYEMRIQKKKIKELTKKIINNRSFL